jgi:predicted DNA-binding protein (UPF0251 family)
VLDEVLMTLDESEALRLAHLDGLYQEEAAGRMGVSRPTFGRILASAHRKVTEALILGKALRIEGGPVRADSWRRLHCSHCRHQWEGAREGARECPRCHGKKG